MASLYHLYLSSFTISRILVINRNHIIGGQFHLWNRNQLITYQITIPILFSITRIPILSPRSSIPIFKAIMITSRSYMVIIITFKQFLAPFNTFDKPADKSFGYVDAGFTEARARDKTLFTKDTAVPVFPNSFSTSAISKRKSAKRYTYRLLLA